MKSEWTKFSEAHPQKEGRYWILTGDPCQSEIPIRRFDFNKGWDGFFSRKWSHWMPVKVPELPEQENCEKY